MATTKPAKRSRKPNPLVKPSAYECMDDFIMLEPEMEAEISEGGIHIPEQARKLLNEGKIVKVGPNTSSHLLKGMYVVFDSSSEYRLDLGGGTVVFVVKESNVILYRQGDVVSKLFPAAKACPHGVPATQLCRKCAEDYDRDFKQK